LHLAPPKLVAQLAKVTLLVAEQLLGGRSRGLGLPLVDGDEDIMMKIVILQHDRSDGLYWWWDWWGYNGENSNFSLNSNDGRVVTEGACGGDR